MTPRLSSMMAGAAKAPYADLDAIVGPGGLLVLAPHPDDESLGCGALLRAAACGGRRVAVIVVTDGRLSHPSSPSVNADALARLRALEVRAALAALHRNIALIEFGYGDCAAPETLPDAAVAATAIADAADDIGATALMAPWRGDPHKDHVATADLARRAHRLRPGLRLWQYPIWGRFAPPEPETGPETGPETQAVASARIVRFDAGENRAAKKAAIACHRTQMTRMIADDPHGFMMTAAMQAHFIDHPEVYLADQ